MPSETSTTSADQSVEELRRELTEARRDLAEAQEQQAATAEILRVISGSPTDLQRVFAEIATTAARLCDTYDAVIRQVDGEELRLVAHHGPVPTPSTIPVSRNSVVGCAVIDRRTIHVADLQSEAVEYPESRNRALQLGHRTALGVPLVRAGEAVGVILIRRTEVHPFTDRQIDLLKTFADQAVIAIGNTRLLEEVGTRNRELGAALEQQTATSEILDVISRSPGELESVFQAVLKSATQLCAAKFGTLYLREGSGFRAAAMHNAPPAFVEARAGILYPPPDTAIGQVARTKRPTQIADVTVERPYVERDPFVVAFTALGGYRSVLTVPLLKEDELIGAISIYRQAVGSFADKEVELVTNFAAQAVIAIENTRLFEAEQASKRELRESLDYQTATSEVLAAISRSPTNVQPVFDTIASSAAKLCNALDAIVLRVDRDMLRLVAHHGYMPTDDVPIHRGTLSGRTVIERRLIHVTDLQAEEVEFPEGSAFARRFGHRTTLSIPLLCEGEAIGNIQIRRAEVRPFTAKQIALVQTFADQAVIAIENSRLFEAEQASKRELQESLEYQTATSEVLSVISRSPNELQPVLDAIVATAARLCDADGGGVSRLKDGMIHRVSFYGFAEKYREILSRPQAVGRSEVQGRAILDRKVAHVLDAKADPEFTWTEAQEAMGFRTLMGVPLLRDGVPIGAITLLRTTVRTFTDKQIELVTTFADQAVIAIENTRLFEQVQARTKELTEALNQQTATGEILGVISRSPTDVRPVFEAIAESAVRLCGANYGSTMRLAGDSLHLVAHRGQSAQWLETVSRLFPHKLTRDLIAGSAILDGEVIHVEDLQNDARFPASRALAQTMGYRTGLCVPMMRGGAPIGAILVFRQDVRPFAEPEIALLRTFADQAVIAIENARLFEEVQARTRELIETLEQQTATSEVLEAISRSPGDLEQVFNTMLASATRICEASFGNMYLRDGELFRLTAAHNAPPALLEHRRRVPLQRPTSIFGRMVSTKTLVHITDLMADPTYAEGEPEVISGVELGGIRTIVMVPMLKENQLIGALTLYRQEVRPFSEKQIDLVANFAKQAVIAIENTRLLKELRESLQQQTATADVLKVISRAAFDLKAVLDTLVLSAARLCNADGVSILRPKDQHYHYAASYGSPPGFDEYIQTLPLRPGRASLAGRVMQERKPTQIVDALSDPDYAMTESQRLGGFRTMLGVPLLRDGTPFGMIILTRKSVQPFTSTQIDLATTFADQAVIAIENTRLFEEVQTRTRELAKTVEDLEIASQHKNQFVANMSHELRTPLAAILGYAELMQEGFYEPLGQKSLDALTRIRSNGRHLLGLINTVLDIAKIESGQFTLNMSEFALESVVETVRSATESLAQNKKLSLRTEVAKTLPIGLGDEQRLTQVLLNLVGNAIKFTDAGEVRVTAKAVDGRFNVSVTDTGPGIPVEHQMRIFEQFHQVDSSNTKAKGGTGLGLAIAKQIVEMHGGRIWVESTLGKGSTFQMDLPTRAELRKPAS
jgi:GAF domain-containing protein/anti-sigma regulatory factor (Ser/Thr protein kinase)